MIKNLWSFHKTFQSKKKLKYKIKLPQSPLPDIVGKSGNLEPRFFFGQNKKRNQNSESNPDLQKIRIKKIQMTTTTTTTTKKCPYLFWVENDKKKL